MRVIEVSNLGFSAASVAIKCWLTQGIFCLFTYLFGFGEWFSNFDFHQSNVCRILFKLGEIRLRQITAERGKGSKAKRKSTKLSAACSDLFYFYSLLFNRSKRDRNIYCSPVKLSFGSNITCFKCKWAFNVEKEWYLCSSDGKTTEVWIFHVLNACCVVEYHNPVFLLQFLPNICAKQIIISVFIEKHPFALMMFRLGYNQTNTGWYEINLSLLFLCFPLNGCKK